MSVVQLSAGSNNDEKERQPLVAVPVAGPWQFTVSLIIPTLNEAKNLPHVLPALPAGVQELDDRVQRLNNERRRVTRARAAVGHDAVADPDWAGRMTAPYVDPAIVGVGGSAQPAWERPPPAWWPREFGWVAAEATAGSRPRCPGYAT
jgi:hypothetical protein